MHFFLRNLVLAFYVLAFVGVPNASLQANCQEKELHKIYVQPEEIIILDEGIFYINGDEILPVRSLHCDNTGLFIFYAKEDKIWDTCPNGHKIYHVECQGCAFWWCNFRCKCCSPWQIN